jgi:cell division protein FtsB
MNFKKLKDNKYFRFISNRYILTILIFGIWMLFIDANSYLTHRKINQEIKTLKTNKAHYQKEIDQDKAAINNLKDPEKLEKFAREEYRMKRENEEIYIIEYQNETDKKNKDE